MPTLRPYQQAAVEQIRQAFGYGNDRVLFVLPTGGGKSYTFCAITQGAIARGNRVCILVHRAELLRQASASLHAMGVRHGLIAAGRSMDLTQSVQVASVQTLARRLRHIPPDWFRLLVVDEAHHSNAGTWAKVLEHCSIAKVLGVTATPVRSDGQGLGAWYSAMVLGPSPQWLTDHGYLAPAKVLAPPGVSLQGLRRRMGDYDMGQAGEMLQAGQAMGDALSHYQRHLSGRTAIAFCCSVAHAEAVAELFNRHGVAAASIDGTMDALKREQLLADLGAGRLKVLTSCALIGEGVDVPSVGGCILLRPTQSVALHLQMIGRCLRPQDGKQAVVLDHVGNCLRLGHHLDEREWTLEGISKRSREAVPSIKVCPACFCAIPSQAQVCSECGHRFLPERRELEHVEGELVEIQRLSVDDRVRLADHVAPEKYSRIGVSPGQAYTVRSCYNRSDGVPIVNLRRGGGHYVTIEATDLVFVATKQGYSQMLEAQRIERQREQAQARSMKELIAIGKKRGMKHPHKWAHHVFMSRKMPLLLDHYLPIAKNEKKDDVWVARACNRLENDLIQAWEASGDHTAAAS